MASGDLLLDADGNLVLDANGNLGIHDGVTDTCCCGTPPSPCACEGDDGPPTYAVSFSDVTLCPTGVCKNFVSSGNRSFKIISAIDPNVSVIVPFYCSAAGGSCRGTCVWQLLIEDAIVVDVYSEFDCAGTATRYTLPYIVEVNYDLDAGQIALYLYAVTPSPGIDLSIFAGSVNTSVCGGTFDFDNGQPDITECSLAIFPGLIGYGGTGTATSL